VKISVLRVILAFEWSLVYTTRKPCCGRETALIGTMPLKIQYVSTFTASSRGSPCDIAASSFGIANIVKGLLNSNKRLKAPSKYQHIIRHIADERGGKENDVTAKTTWRKHF